MEKHRLIEIIRKEQVVKKKAFLFFVFVVTIIAAIFAVSMNLAVRGAAPPLAPPPIALNVYFSPKGGCTEAVVEAINAAKKSVAVQAYSFTSDKIAKALLDAKKRGVGVEVILDKSNETDKYSSATFFANEGVSMLIDDRHAIAHNKIVIIDGSVVITGSFNFTKAAESENAENLLIIQNAPELVKKYIANYEEHRGHSRAYKKGK